MSENPVNPSVHVDDEWKQQAQREKERLAGKPAEAPPAEPPPAPAAEAPKDKPPEPAAKPHRDLPPASFGFLIEQFVSQSLLYMGLMSHPATGKTEKDLDVARHAIDMLGMIQAKTKGNLSADEEQALTQSLYELRMTFVKVKAQK